MLKYMYYDYSKNALIQVYTTHQDALSKTAITKHLDNLCLDHGSSLLARRKYFKEKMEIYKFIPIVISREEIYFPLSNTKNHDCIWVHYSAIKKITLIKKECIIHFIDNTSLTCKNGQRISHTLRNIRLFLRSA